jgi:PAS domain S-box-containing protein
MQLDENEDKLLRSVALQNAKAVLLARERAERDLISAKEALERKTEELIEQRRWFEVTLSSIGDAVITTDTAAKITFLNPMAEHMTGWKSSEAIGQPLEKVFRIVNEHTRRPADNPVTKVLQDGKTVALANHTALIARDERETAIDDSAAPIRDGTGKISGVVMVFHDVTEQRRAETALLETKERVTNILESITDAFLVLDKDWHLTHVNPKAEQILLPLNKTRANLLGKNYWREFPDVIGTPLEAGLRGAVARQEKVSLELFYPPLHGWFEIRIYPGKGGLSIYFLDITAQKKTELERERLTGVLERSLNEIYIFDTQTLRFEYVNEGGRRNLGYTLEELRQKTPLDIKPEFTEASFRKMVAPLLSGEQEKHVFFTVHRRADGTDYPVEVHLQAVTNAGQTVFIAVILDITERKKAEEASSRLAAVVESSDDAIISKTLEGIITSWNEGAKRMYGYSAGEVIGKSVTILIPSNLLNEEPAIIERLKRGERIEHYETMRRRKDGTLLDVALTVSPIKDSSGKIVGASKIARDVTERKRAEKELRRAKDELEERIRERTASLRETIGELEAFSYSISHDMRAPLRAMQGYSLLLAEEHGSQVSPEGKEYIRRISTAAARMDRLIQDVLNYSRVARIELPMEPVNIQRLLEDILQTYPSFQPPATNIQFNGNLPVVLGNEAVLTQCISNLLGNAVKFTPPGIPPAIRVWAEEADDPQMIRLCFQDNGVGIDERQHENIFGMFQRVSKNYEGTGIGLAIVKKGVERMGGKVGLKSVLGGGSTFWLELKRANSGK